MSTLQTRQPRGITTGGQFAATAHAEPDVLLAALSPTDIRELAKPIDMPPGSSVYTDGQRGTVSDHPSPSPKRIIVDLDAGGSVYARKEDVVPWDAWLDATMPAVEHDLLDSPVPAAAADRMLHATLRGVRNSHSSATELGDTYHAGRAEAGAEIAAALLDTTLDAAAIRRAGKNVLSEDMIDALHDRDRLTSFSSGEAITPLRARQLAGHFADEAVQAHSAACAEEERGNHGSAQIHHGRSHAFVAGALKFVQGCEPDPHTLDREQAMIRSLVEGNTRPDSILRAGLQM